MLRRYIFTPQWSVRSVVNPQPEKVVSEATLQKLLKLSGLREEPGKNEALLAALNLQMSFIKSLYGEEAVLEASNDTLFRLMRAEGCPLALEDIQRQIRGQKPDKEKGEVGFARNDYFIV